MFTKTSAVKELRVTSPKTREHNDDQTIEMLVPLLAKSTACARWPEGACLRELRQPLLKGKQTALIHNSTSSSITKTANVFSPFCT